MFIQKLLDISVVFRNLYCFILFGSSYILKLTLNSVIIFPIAKSEVFFFSILISLTTTVLLRSEFKINQNLKTIDKQLVSIIIK